MKQNIINLYALIMQIFREKMILKGFMAVQAVDKYKKMLNEETLLAVKLANKIR